MATDDSSLHDGADAPQDDLRATLALVGELAEAMGGQIRRARRLLADQPRADIAPGVLEGFEEVADSLHRRCVLLVNGGHLRLEPGLGPAGSTALSAVAPLDSESQTENAVRTLARDLKREGRLREDVVRTLADDFGLENVEHVVSEVFGSG